MMDELYKMIYKRKSFHVFKGNQKLSKLELREIENKCHALIPLLDTIDVKIKIVLREETSCKRGEYCILFYSEKKNNYLINIGYIGEQLDLWLASRDIGVCWYGAGKVEASKYKNLDFVIMLAIQKVDKTMFRKDMFKSKRKDMDEIWQGNIYQDIANIVRYAPSACNSQPWLVESDDTVLQVYRYKMPGKRGIMPVKEVTYYNRIDIGIFILFIEVCLQHLHIPFQRVLYEDIFDEEIKVHVASYNLTCT